MSNTDQVVKVKKPRRKSWTLIWWTASHEKDIIPTLKIPLKDRKKIGGVITLQWDDKITNKKSNHEAKIVATSCKYLDIFLQFQ